MDPLPEQTPTYVPVSHYDLATNATRVGKELVEPRGFKLDRAQFALAKEGQRMFGLLAFSNGVGGMGLAAGFRNSYDKSMSVGFAIGARVFVCDNLALTGELVVMRRHVGDVIKDLESSLISLFYKATATFDQIVEDRARMTQVALNDRRAYGILGEAYGEGLLGVQQFTKAAREWRNPRHEEFALRNLWSLYNCVTGAFKAKGMWKKFLEKGGIHERHDKNRVDAR